MIGNCYRIKPVDFFIVGRKPIDAKMLQSGESGGIGQRIGEVLIEQQAATPHQVERAAEQQRQMREQRLGDILVSRNIVTHDQLVTALAQQSHMPMVRIGEALMSLGMIDINDLQAALRQQELDRGVPLGEILVRSGVVTQPDLQMAMARKMGWTTKGEPGLPPPPSVEELEQRVKAAEKNP